MTKQEIIKKYLGVPFLNCGRSTKGLDCYGLVKCIYADQGIELYDTEAEYSARWCVKGQNFLIENQHRDWIEIKDPRITDLVCFNNSAGVGYHIGVILDQATFIHTTKAGTVVGRIGDWQTKIRGYYRHRGLNKFE